jgi:hypothetical protein
MYSTIRDLEGGCRQDERQQCEDVGKALAGPILEKFVDKRGLFGVFDPVEQALTFPDGATDGDLATHSIKDALPVDSDPRIFLEDGRQRAAALEPDLEPQVFEAEQ